MGDYIHEVEHLLSDPAHMTVEFMFVLFDVYIISKYRDWRHGHKKGKRHESEGSSS